jgi:hypothetical protein
MRVSSFACLSQVNGVQGSNAMTTADHAVDAIVAELQAFRDAHAQLCETYKRNQGNRQSRVHTAPGPDYADVVDARAQAAGETEEPAEWFT